MSWWSRRRQRRRRGLLLRAIGGAGHLDPAVGVRDGFVVERDQPGRLGRDGQEGRILPPPAAPRRPGGGTGTSSPGGGSAGAPSRRARRSRRGRRPPRGAVGGDGRRLRRPRAPVVGRGGEEGVERPLVEQASLTTEELALDLVADEACRKLKRSSVASSSSPACTSAQDVEELGLLHVRGPGEHVEASSVHRSRPPREPGVRRWTALEPAHRLQGPGQAGAQEVARASIAAPGGGQDLLDEERVAAVRP